MVDFNNETTVTRPAADIVRVLILERRNNVIEAFEFYANKDKQGISMGIAAIQSRLFSLFLELQASLKRKRKDRYEDIKAQVQSRKYDDLLEAFFVINEYLDELKLTQIDTHQQLGGNIVERNAKQGVPV